jgi:hypothetical protein
MPIQSVKKKSRRLLKDPEISDYTDYETITPISPTPPSKRRRVRVGVISFNSMRLN